jgi:hypothetical protein
MKLLRPCIIATLIATPALANKLHQEQPTASEVKAWEADQAKIKKQAKKKKKAKSQRCCQHWSRRHWRPPDTSK